MANSINFPIKWVKTTAESENYISLTGITFFGYAWVTVNGESAKYHPHYRSADGYWYIINCGSEELFLNVSPDRAEARLLAKGELNFGTEDKFGEYNGLLINNKVRSGIGSFFSLITLSLINIGLILVNAPISFPFSVFAVSTPVAFGVGGFAESGEMIVMIISTIISITILAIYFGLFYATFRSVAASWIAFGLFILDTIALLGFALLSGSISEFVVDIAFHGWVLYSLFNLCIAKGKLAKAVNERVTEYVDEVKLHTEPSTT